MNDDPRVDQLREALRLRDEALDGKISRGEAKRGTTRGRTRSSSIEQDVETAIKVCERQGIDSAARFLARRTGLSTTTCLEILRQDRAADAKMQTPDGVEDLVINEAFVGGSSFGEMALLVLQRMKHRGQKTGDMTLTDGEIVDAAKDLVELLEMLCLGNVSPARLLRAALSKYDLLQDDPESPEFADSVLRIAKKFPLDIDIRRVFP